MCECTLLVQRKTGKTIRIEDAPHNFVYGRYGKDFVLLEGIKMNGIINYSAAHEIKDMYGGERGYMFIIGEQALDSSL